MSESAPPPSGGYHAPEPPAPRKLPDLLRSEYEIIRQKITAENFDYVTVVTGYEGSGKSTLALKVAGFTEPGFTGERVAFDGEELLELMADAPPGSSILFDEGGKGLYAREALTKTNRSITTAAMIARARNYHLIICMPSFWDLDLYFRSHRARAWLYVVRRGVAIAHAPRRTPYSRDTFWERVFRYYFGPLTGPTWDAYNARKMAFIEKALKGEPEERKGGRDGAEDAAARDTALAEEVAANDEFWTPKGYAKRGLIAARYGLSAFHARHVAEVAKGLRDG